MAGNIRGGAGGPGPVVGQPSLPYQTGMYQPFVGKRKRHDEFFFCGETADDLSMILDGAVTMLQDLDENRKYDFVI